MEGLEGKGIEMKERRKKIYAASKAYTEGLDKRLKDPEYAIAYLNTLLEENDSDLLLLVFGTLHGPMDSRTSPSLRVLIGKAFTKRFQKAGIHGSAPSWMF